MKECWSEGDLRAYVDRELPAGELDRISAHVETCEACAARLKEIAGRAGRIAACMADLADVPASIPVGRPRQAWKWAAAAAVLAAGIAAAVALKPVRHPVAVVTPPAPVVTAPQEASAAAPVQVAAPPPEVAVKRAAARHRRSPRPAVNYFMALDDEPIDTGVVMRMALQDGMQADVIVDSQGRARAIRPVSYGRGK